MESWWQLGEGAGCQGEVLSVSRITCAFCEERGHFKRVYHGEKQKPNSRKKLNFDVFQCENCAGLVHVLWSASEFSGSQGLHSFHVLPWPLGKAEPSENWPQGVQRFWTQAKDSLKSESWDAAAVMARSALQTALRDKAAVGSTLKSEIDDLANKGALPPLMKDWSNEIRLLGNDSAHPDPKASATDPQDARDIARFLDFLLIYLYDLPKEISDYRQRRNTATP